MHQQISFIQLNTMEETTQIEEVTVAYLVCGPTAYRHQTILSVLTLYHYIGLENRKVKVVVYTTDNELSFKKYFGELPVDIEYLTKEKIREFGGPAGYIYRMKTAVIRDCLQKEKRNVLFLDTDTFFLNNPIGLFNKIKPGFSIMNAPEYNLLDGGDIEYQHWFDLRRSVKRYNSTAQAEVKSISLATMMWNAGVIGISYEDAKVVDEIIALTDELHSLYSSFLSEQFATSYILKTYTQLSSSENYIEHYWAKNKKKFFSQQIALFLENYKNEATERPLYDIAFDFVQNLNKMSIPHVASREPLLSRVAKRAKLIGKVALTGRV